MFWFLIISLLLNVAFGVVAYRAISRMAMYEDYCEAVVIRLMQILADIRSVDIRGAFEADDEVGLVYKGISGLIHTLEEFVPIEDVNGA